ncbi:MAG: hypothetical protein BYD32DRAFT_448545 [Podila humilis]|nr:MAG: hypothetical protein BYD32DRAFT_448545 [Podila humilis]
MSPSQNPLCLLSMSAAEIWTARTTQRRACAMLFSLYKSKRADLLKVDEFKRGSGQRWDAREGRRDGDSQGVSGERACPLASGMFVIYKYIPSIQKRHYLPFQSPIHDCYAQALSSSEKVTEAESTGQAEVTTRKTHNSPSNEILSPDASGKVIGSNDALLAFLSSVQSQHLLDPPT